MTRAADRLVRDVRAGVRVLRSPSGPVSAAVLVMSVGIAAAVTLYTTFRVVANDLPPVPGVERIARLYVADSAAPMGRRPPTRDDAARLAGLLDGAADMTVAAGGVARVEIDGCASVTDRAPILAVDPQFFGVAGVAPKMGRTWTSGDLALGAPAVLSPDLWRRTCPSSIDVVGRAMHLDGRTYQITGVMPDGFWLGARGTDVWVAAQARKTENVDVLLRLTGAETVDALNRRLSATAPVGVAVALTDPRVRRSVQAFTGLLGPALLVLLVACANAAALLIARTVGRERDLAIALSLGATPGQLARQVFAEVAAIAAVAGLVALPLVVVGTMALRRAFAVVSPGLAREVVVDPQVLFAALVIVLGAALLAGLLPALRVGRTDVLALLARRPGRFVFRRGRYGTADLLVVVQMALAVVLVVVTTMFGRVFHAVLDATPGEHPDRILVGALAPVPGAGDRAGLVPQVVAALRAVPGMRVALADGPPLISRYPPPLRTDDEGATGRCAGTVRRVTPEYFAALGLRVGAGRLLQEDDEPGVAVASAALARRCWTGTALGHVVTVGGTGRDRRVNVIGVVTDARARADVPGFEALDLYVPYGQPAEGESVTVVIASQGPMAARGVDLAAVVDRASGRGLSLESAATLAQLAERELAGPRTLTTVLGVLGGIALVLATAGIYASLSQAFARHRRDYGVRAALGAPPLSLAGLAVGRDSLLVSIGSVAGIVVTLAVTHVVWPEALRIGGADLRMWITLCGVLVASGLVASAGPVWRATHLDPVDALRRADE